MARCKTLCFFLAVLTMFSGLLPAVVAEAAQEPGSIYITHRPGVEMSTEIAAESGRINGGVESIFIDMTAGAVMSANDWNELKTFGASQVSGVSLTITGLGEIGSSGLVNCAWLKSVSLPDTVIIGDMVFARCANLESVRLPKADRIGSRVFEFCNKLAEYRFGIVPGDIHEQAFFRVMDDGEISVHYTGGEWPNLDWPDNMRFIMQADVPGGANPGGANPGGANPGGANPGGANPGGENPGGENPGNENPGGGNHEDENPGGENPEGENPGNNDNSGADVPDPLPDESGSTQQREQIYPSFVRTEDKKAGPPAPLAELPVPVTREEVASAVQKALSSSKNQTGKQAVVRFINKKYISLEQLKEIAQAAKEAGKSAIIHADTTVDGVVINRLYIDPSKARRGMRLMTGSGAEKTLRLFEKHSENALAVLSLDQQGGFGAKTGIAFKLKLPESVKAEKLAFYSYNPETNRYKRIKTRGVQMGKDYIWFESEKSGLIIISSERLKKTGKSRFYKLFDF